jgi:hypothetical protein
MPIVGRAAGPLIGASLLTDYNPEKAKYDDKGRLVSRPMLVPAVGERLQDMIYPDGNRPRQADAPSRMPRSGESWLEDEDGELFPAFTPVKRMGTFTPVAPTEASADEELARERETDIDKSMFADDMRGEEMEQHMSDVAQSRGGSSGTDSGAVDNAAARLERSAEALERAAGTMTGSLRVAGTADVTSVMGDVMRLLGGRGAAGVDHLTVCGLMAQAVGITPLNDGRPPVRDDLARFGMFADSAARLGLTPEQTERVGREVKDSPDQRMTPETRAELLDGAVAAGRSRDEAEREVNRLEIAARLLPNEITAYGSMPVPSITVAPEVKVEPIITVEARDGGEDSETEYDNAMRSNSSLSGSEGMLGGNRS